MFGAWQAVGRTLARKSPGDEGRCIASKIYWKLEAICGIAAGQRGRKGSDHITNPMKPPREQPRMRSGCGFASVRESRSMRHTTALPSQALSSAKPGMDSVAKAGESVWL